MKMDKTELFGRYTGRQRNGEFAMRGGADVILFTMRPSTLGDKEALGSFVVFD